MSDAPTFGRYAEVPVDRMTREMNFFAVPAGSPGLAR
jgi:hypothetical protein